MKLTVVELAPAGAGMQRAIVLEIEHGQDMVGRNFVAVINGDLHKDCDWCYKLRARCGSRRLA